jgi:SAM-dependent methyltransferase
MDSKFCCFCAQQFPKFLPYAGLRSVPPLMTALDVIGSDISQFECPNCHCHDRERHLYLYLNAMGLLQTFKNADVLHFAPERMFQFVIENQQPKSYVRGDLFPANPQVNRIDMLNIQFPEHTFDVVIANHVLEHVDNDARALTELRRVLKPGGLAILQTPYSAMLTATFADPGINTDQARIQAYGQEDHVRLYGADIFVRFASVGFTPRIQNHAALLSEIDSLVYGVNPREPLFLFERLD